MESNLQPSERLRLDSVSDLKVLMEDVNVKLDKLCLILLHQYLEARDANQGLVTQMEGLKHSYEVELLELTRCMQELVKEKERLEKERIEKERKRKVRKEKGKKVRLRSPVKPGDYTQIMLCVRERKPLNSALLRVGMTVLFLTGIRVSNLRFITLSDLSQLFDGKDFIIPSIKTKDNKLLSFPANEAFAFYLDQRRPDFSIISKSLGPSDIVWGFSREHLTRKINKVLKEAGVLLNKNLKSHSFRIGLATSVAEKHTIYEAQAILGHARISTTERYVHSRLSKSKKQGILNSAFDVVKNISLPEPERGMDCNV